MTTRNMIAKRVLRDLHERSDGSVKSTLINATTSLCRVCKNAIPASVVALESNDVWMKKRCPEHGIQDVLISTNADWYRETLEVQTPEIPPRLIKNQEELGCPFDCGPCEQHSQKVRLPVVTITSSCNLSCPICYVHNKNNDPFHMDKQEFAKVLEHLVADHGGELDLINFTGGDPTMHPNFLDFVEMSKEAGIHRVSICTNGIKFVKDESLLKRLAEMGGRVALAFDSFDYKVDYQMQGAHLIDLKMKCLDLLEKYDVATTLIPVITKGLNDHEVGDFIQLAIDRPNVRHIEFHTMTYTGQGGVSCSRDGRISMYEVLEEIELRTNGLLLRSDFVSSPCAHPLCYQIAYLLLDPDGGQPISFLRFMDKETLYNCLGDRLYLEPSARLESAMQEAIYNQWTSEEPDAERILALLNRLLRHLFPSGKSLTREESLLRSEQTIKAVYVHSHMDEETFDTERIMQCCDSNCYADGTTIPVCNYNILYREKESAFMDHPKEWNERSGGSKSKP